MLTPYISSWLGAPSIRDKLKSIYTYVQLARLILLNYFGRKAITLPGTPAIVSLTSYGGRMRFVHLVIESIGRGELRPQRLILWLDEASAPLADTPGLMRLAKRGLEIKLCRDYRSYKKFYPYVESNDAFTTSLVTADDDVLYPRGWLKNLVAASQRMPNAIVCSRGRYIELQNSVVAPYQYWKLLRTTKPSRRNFATGVGGVLYPPLFQKVLRNLCVCICFAYRGSVPWRLARFRFV
jgi:hypothetical protein